MKLRSSRVLKRGKPEIDPGIKKQESFDDCDENLEMGIKEIGNSDEKGSFLGSEVLDPVKGSVNISETGSVLNEEMKSPNVESVTFADNKETLICDLENTDNDSVVDGDGGECTVIPLKGKRERKRKNVENSECNGKKIVKKEKVEKNAVHVSSRVLRSRNTTSVSGGNVNDDGGLGSKQDNEGVLVKNAVHVSIMPENGNPKKKIERRGRPRKIHDNEVSCGGVVNDDGGLGSKQDNEGVLVKNAVHVSIMPENGNPKKKIERRGRPRKIHDNEVSCGGVVNDDGGLGSKQDNEGVLVKNAVHVSIMPENGSPKKKIERRGRPRKIHDNDVSCGGVVNDDGGLGSKQDIEGVLVKNVVHVSIMPENGSPKKKIERRGRPRKIHDENPRPKKKQKHLEKLPKIQGEITSLPLVKRRGRPRKTVSDDIIPLGPRKVQGKEGIQKNRLKDMIFKKFKRRGRPLKSEAKTLATHVIKMKTLKLMAVKNTPKVQKIQKNQKNEEKNEHLEGRQLKQKLLREKIADMLLKSGWTIDRRQRQDRAYKDAVYIEPKARRSHWSVTRAYSMLKKKIEKGEADSNEISAFIEIPDEEISILFRYVDKELGYKKKKYRIRKNVKKGKIVSEKKKKLGKKPRLLARCFDKGSKQDNESSLVIKKRNLLSWMIDSGVILSGWKIQYGKKPRRQKKSTEGTISNDGILCGCCDEIMGLSDFVSHCGGNTGRVFDNVYLDSGTSFRKCLMDSWKKEESNIIRVNVVVQGDDPNDDTCNICGDGGDLICCDGCPSTFHQSCLDIQNFPSGDWNCIFCLCKFCGVISVSTPQVEDSRDINTPEMLSCHLCEEKFHQLCLQEVEDVNIDSNGPPFCGTKCQEIYERLQTYIGVKNELKDGFSWTLLQRFDVDQGLTVDETQLKVERNSKLSVAFSVMDECFVPIVDERSGTSIIRNVVYNCGSNFRRLDYSGFVTAVLEKGDELITAASIRIHGYRLAEMPFIGTRNMYRRQGMCRRLLDAIESTLASIGVEELIIPAIPALLETWTTVFGFMPLEESKRKVLKSMNMIVFPGIDMVIKPLRSSAGAEKDANNEQTEEPTVGKDVFIDYKQFPDRCSGPHLGNDKSVICDLNFPVKNVVQSDADGQTSIDSESFPDCTVGPSSMDSTSVENRQSPLTSKMVPKNMFDLNLHPSEVETDMNIVSDDSQVCVKSTELSDSSAAGQPDSKCPESQPLAML